MLPVKKFTDFIEQNNLFTQGSKILAAVSGGMDSVIMVHLLKSAGFNFGIAHCNFQLRDDESTGDEQFCYQLAQQLDVPFHNISFDTLAYAADEKVSTQMAARTLRYQWFEQVRQQADYSIIALAHHQNDAIETILLNLTRGTGIAGLHGILPKNGLLVRPLLFLTRDEILTLVNRLQLPYREDSSNASVKYARNKIRLEVIPALKQLNPGLEKTFDNNLKHFRELELLLNERVDKLKQQLFVAHANEIRVPLEDLRVLKPQHLLLFNLLQDFGVNDTLIDDLISSLNKHSGRVFETTGFKLILDRTHLIITPKKNEKQPETLIALHDRHVDYGHYKLAILHDESPLIVKNNPMAVSTDADLLIYPLTLRPWKTGDHFTPLGMKGRKKVSDFFIDQKVPLHLKDEIPLIVNGNGDIVWVGGYRLNDQYKVTANTKKVTIFELANLNI
ncbi:tRNA lysidine(34) synthetase TilS [Mucilaginibacter xinganensis]|uniref:tRNA(Ile)-lysidine synthase n=1 Tax=Mucilaginibacter xinganensis TaxID=1234841 RepID=A0A223NQG9_9SPHI|nr:tRNA lysidine(34) synthetase TilS [Mucilaginibacter xinganensis]ASU32149.1 tRNA(Ile)-lysidine synthetase [Mucilaginibacter xinganensis]